MSTLLNPYLNFNGNARDAMTFYHSVFGGELQITSFGEMGMSDDPAAAELIMHSMLTTPNGLTLMGSDLPPKMEFQPGNNFSISLSGNNEPELRGYWDKLAEGATIAEPLTASPWGSTFGMLVDRFGVMWMVDISSSAA